MTDWIDREVALQRLGVRPQTLYAYVSRGRVRAEPDPAEPRRSRYRASDVAALAERGARGRKAADVASAAIAWGEPVLPSAITAIIDGRLYYRGRDAADLAESETFEHVARLLRGGLGDPAAAPQRPLAGPTVQARMFAVLATRAATALPITGRPVAAVAQEGAELLDLMAAAAVGEEDEGPIHERFGRAWKAPRERWDLIRRALVLLADHELNPSAFAARISASTGASLAACLLAGLGALSGPRHGGMSERVESFLEAAQRRGAAGALARWPQASQPPGFGHPLYPDGDPRAAALLAAFEAPAQLREAAGAIGAETGLRPNVDFALAALRRTLALPPEAPFALFAAARSAGWVAHAMEQAQSGRQIRPRARYVGPPPAAFDR